LKTGKELLKRAMERAEPFEFIDTGRYFQYISKEPINIKKEQI